MILFRVLWWIVTAPVRFVFWLAVLADAGGDGDAERGRQRWLGKHHPSSHLHRGVRP